METKDKVRLIREAKGLSKSALSVSLKHSPGYVSLIESGRREPSESFIQSLQKLYSVSDVWWRTGEGEIFSGRVEIEKTEISPEDQENLGLILKLNTRKKRELRAELYRLLAEQERDSLKDLE